MSLLLNYFFLATPIRYSPSKFRRTNNVSILRDLTKDKNAYQLKDVDAPGRLSHLKLPKEHRYDHSRLFFSSGVWFLTIRRVASHLVTT